VEKKLNPLGIFSAVGTLVMLALIAWRANVFPMVINELNLLVSGGYQEITENHTAFLMMFPVILAVVALELPCTVACGALIGKILGKHGRHALDFLLNMGEGNHFFTFFVAVVAEEIIARWFFLGLLTKIPLLSSVTAFYVLFLLGNGIWSLIHLPNYKEKKDRNVLRVLPQFVAGIFFTYVFVKYGLLAVILAHFASNSVLFAVFKVQKIGFADVLNVVYASICAFASYSLMTKPLTDVMVWFTDNPVFRLQGWEFWDYVKLSVFVSALFTMAFGLLLYDRNDKEQLVKKISLPTYFLYIPLTIAMLYGIYSLLGLLILSVPYRVVMLAIVLACMQKSRSGSLVAGSFWLGLPDVYISMCILQALGFWAAIGWLVVDLAVQIPRILLTKTYQEGNEEMDTELNPQKVEAVFRDCLFNNGEDLSGAVEAEGIRSTVFFHPGRLQNHKAEIETMLRELPTEFKEGKGNGGSFLDACTDRHGNLWTGFQQRVDELFMLGLAIDKVKLTYPRERWYLLPGGMPYYIVCTN